MENREKEHLEAVEQALLDMTDGEKWHDIQAQTGLSEERCKEILVIRNRIAPK